MDDDSADRDPLRRRILESVAATGLSAGVAGCLGVPNSTTGTTSADAADATGTPVETPGETPNTDTPDTDQVSDRLVGEGPAVGLEAVATGVRVPTDLASPGGDDGRLFVTDQFGAVYAFDPDGETPVDLRDRDPVLDLEGRIVTGAEAGLLGLAFHPDFADNGRLFVRYSAPRSETTPDRYHHVEVLSEFRAPGERFSVDPGSERVLLEIPQPESHHNSGEVLFGPEGYLYLTTGDGGGFHAEDTLDRLHLAGSSQQTRGNLLGGVLRIDIDERSSPAHQTESNEGEGDSTADGENSGDEVDRLYAIPQDNPLAGEGGGDDEYYAWGFRNPWGASFDGDDLYVADVGAQRFEWVDLVEKGGNYGWSIREGMHCFDPRSPMEPPDDCLDRIPVAIRDGEPFVDPVIEYPHEHEDGDEPVGMAVVGGYVYRGNLFPDLQGEYVFGDLLGRLFAASSPDDDESLHPYYRDRDVWPIRELEIASQDRGDGSGYEREEGEEKIPTYRPEVFLSVLGRLDDELYAGTTNLFEARDGNHAGEIHRIVPPGE